jgi:hypothetical protein
MKGTCGARAGSAAAGLTCGAYTHASAARGSEDGTLDGCDGYYAALAANFQQAAANHVTGA